MVATMVPEMAKPKLEDMEEKHRYLSRPPESVYPKSRDRLGRGLKDMTTEPKMLTLPGAAKEEASAKDEKGI